MEIRKNLECKKCFTAFVYEQKDTWLDEKGFGYSTKLVKCPNCGTVNVIKYIEDRTMAKLNVNDWEYEDSYCYINNH